MKIRQVSTYGTGGAGKACLRLTAALRHVQGVDSKALIAANAPKDIAYIETVTSSTLELILRRRYTKWLHYLALRNHPPLFEPFALPRSGFNLASHPAIEEADIVNFHWVNNLLDYRSFFRRYRRKVVWTLHDMEPFTGGNHYTVGFDEATFQRLIEQNIALKVAALQTADITVVCLNQWMLELSLKSKVLGRFRHEIIPNSLDLNVYQPSESRAARRALALPQNKKIVLFVSEFLENRRKGYQHLLSALQLLQNSPTGDQLFLAVVGKGKANDIEAQLPVKHFGFIKDEKTLAKIYSAADVFVIPSEEDNMPNTIVESLSSGTPVAGFSVGGISELINQPTLGALSQEISATGLAKAIETVLNTPLDRRQIRQIAETRFAPTRQAKAYLELYRDILTT